MLTVADSMKSDGVSLSGSLIWPRRGVGIVASNSARRRDNKGSEGILLACGRIVRVVLRPEEATFFSFRETYQRLKIGNNDSYQKHIH